MKDEEVILTKNRKIYISIVIMVLIIGGYFASNNLRPVSERKQQKREVRYGEKDVNQTKNKIKEISKKIEKNPSNVELIFERSKMYYSITKIDEAIIDLEKCFELEDDINKRPEILEKLESYKKVQKYLKELNK